MICGLDKTHKDTKMTTHSRVTKVVADHRSELGQRTMKMDMKIFLAFPSF